MSAYYSHVIKAEKTGEREITFTFDQPGNRELPQIVGQLTVLPKHWWEGKDAQGKQARHRADHARSAARHAAPTASRNFVPGRSIVYERVQDYWGNGCHGECRREQFRGTALRVFPRHHRRARSLQGRPNRLAHREQRQGLGDRLRFPGGQRKARGAGRIRDPQFRRDAGLRLQYPARQVQGCARAPRLQLSPSTSRK